MSSMDAATRSKSTPHITWEENISVPIEQTRTLRPTQGRKFFKVTETCGRQGLEVECPRRNLVPGNSATRVPRRRKSL